MIRIDVTIDRNDGSEAAANSVIPIVATLDFENTQIKYQIKVYTSSDNYNTGKEPMNDLSDIPGSYTETLSSGDWANMMAAADTDTDIEEYLQDYIETIVGVGDTTII